MANVEFTRVLEAMARGDLHGIHPTIEPVWDQDRGPETRPGFVASIQEPNTDPGTGVAINLGRSSDVRLERREAIEFLKRGALWLGPPGEEPSADEIEILRWQDRYTWTVFVGGQRQNSSHPIDFATSSEAFAAARRYVEQSWREVNFTRVDRVRVA